jgi:hypothetical protein
VTTPVETLEFQSEARQLLQLMIHSVYSNKDTFLRELVSNASDALDKLRLEAYQDKDLDADTADLRIELSTDRVARTVTVRDNGIGMTRDEVISLIGTIAKSGTAEFLRKLKESKQQEDLIGQFGVGFYSSFMVADKVTLVTRRAGTADGVRWESTGEGTYTVEPAEDAPQGTTVTLHLKPEDTEDRLFDYTDKAVLAAATRRQPQPGGNRSDPRRPRPAATALRLHGDRAATRRRLRRTQRPCDCGARSDHTTAATSQRTAATRWRSQQLAATAVTCVGHTTAAAHVATPRLR